MNKNSIIGFVLIFAIMMGFSWYQSKQYSKQVEAQAQLDSIARVEQMAAMALDSMHRAEGVVETTGVKVQNMPVYKDSMLTEARFGQAQVYKLSNDKMEIEFTTKGAQPYSVKLNDYKTYDSLDLYLIKPEGSQLGVSVFAGAMPPQPQMPMMPMRSGSTLSQSDRKSTAAIKSSVLISGEAMYRTLPPLSPVNEGSKAIVRKPRSAMVCA